MISRSISTTCSMPQLLDQRPRQRTQAGADLDHGVVCLRVDGANDVGDDLLIHQEILAKTFSGFMHFQLILFSVSVKANLASVQVMPELKRLRALCILKLLFVLR